MYVIKRKSYDFSRGRVQFELFENSRVQIYSKLHSKPYDFLYLYEAIARNIGHFQPAFVKSGYTSKNSIEIKMATRPRRNNLEVPYDLLNNVSSADIIFEAERLISRRESNAVSIVSKSS
jgi:hypothetical protein